MDTIAAATATRDHRIVSPDRTGASATSGDGSDVSFTDLIQQATSRSGARPQMGTSIVNLVRVKTAADDSGPAPQINDAPPPKAAAPDRPVRKGADRDHKAGDTDNRGDTQATTDANAPVSRAGDDDKHDSKADSGAAKPQQADRAVDHTADDKAAAVVADLAPVQAAVAAAMQVQTVAATTAAQGGAQTQQQTGDAGPAQTATTVKAAQGPQQAKVDENAGADATPDFDPSAAAKATKTTAATAKTDDADKGPSRDLAAQMDDMSRIVGPSTRATISVTTHGADSAQTSQPSSMLVGNATVINDAMSQDGHGQNSSGHPGEQDQNSAGLAVAGTGAAQATDAAAAAEAQTFAAALNAQATTQTVEGKTGETGPAPLAGVGAASGPQAAGPTQKAQAAAAPRPTREPMKPEVAEQISVQIDKAVKEGKDQITVQMKPEALGKIEVKLEVAHDGKVNATVTADNKDTLAMLQKDAPGLEKALNDAGLRTDSASLSFNLRGEQQQQQQQQQANQNGQNGRQGGGDHGWGQGNASEQDALTAAAANAAAYRGMGPATGVDISV